MSTLALLVLALFLALLALTALLAFSRACVYATLLDELDTSSAPCRIRAARTRAGQASTVQGRNLRAASVARPACALEFGHEPC